MGKEEGRVVFKEINFERGKMRALQASYQSIRASSVGGIRTYEAFVVLLQQSDRCSDLHDSSRGCSATRPQRSSVSFLIWPCSIRVKFLLICCQPLDINPTFKGIT